MLEAGPGTALDKQQTLSSVGRKGQAPDVEHVYESLQRWKFDFNSASQTEYGGSGSDNAVWYT